MGIFGGRHYRRSASGNGVRRVLCKILDNIMARTAGRHSRSYMRMRARFRP